MKRGFARLSKQARMTHHAQTVSYVCAPEVQKAFSELNGIILTWYFGAIWWQICVQESTFLSTHLCELK